MITDEANPDDWYMLAAERLRAADMIFAAAGSSFSAVELLQESVERYLKGYLISQGWQLIRTHNLNDLIAAAIPIDARFSSFDYLAENLTDQFFLQHYPGGDMTDVGSDFVELRRLTDDLIQLIAPPSRTP